MDFFDDEFLQRMKVIQKNLQFLASPQFYNNVVNVISQFTTVLSRLSIQQDNVDWQRIAELIGNVVSQTEKITLALVSRADTLPSDNRINSESLAASIEEALSLVPDDFEQRQEAQNVIAELHSSQRVKIDSSTVLSILGIVLSLISLVFTYQSSKQTDETLFRQERSILEIQEDNQESQELLRSLYDMVEELYNQALDLPEADDTFSDFTDEDDSDSIR